MEAANTEQGSSFPVVCLGSVSEVAACGGCQAPGHQSAPVRTELGFRSLGREMSPQRLPIQAQATAGLAEAEWPFAVIPKIPERMGDRVCPSGFAAALLMTVSGAQNAHPLSRPRVNVSSFRSWPARQSSFVYPQMAERASAILSGYSVQGAEVRGSLVAMS